MIRYWHSILPTSCTLKCGVNIYGLTKGLSGVIATVAGSERRSEAWVTGMPARVSSQTAV